MMPPKSTKAVLPEENKYESLVKVSTAEAEQGGDESVSTKGNQADLLEKPKRPLSAYNLFFRDERAKLKEDPLSPPSTEQTHPRPKVDFSGLAKVIAKRWKRVDASVKQEYEDLAEAGRAIYHVRITAWREQRSALGLPYKRKNKKRNPSNKVKQQVQHVRVAETGQVTREQPVSFDPVAPASKQDNDQEPLRLLPPATSIPNSGVMLGGELSLETMPVSAFGCLGGSASSRSNEATELVDPFSDRPMITNTVGRNGNVHVGGNEDISMFLNNYRVLDDHSPATTFQSNTVFVQQLRSSIAQADHHVTTDNNQTEDFNSIQMNWTPDQLNPLRTFRDQEYSMVPEDSLGSGATNSAAPTTGFLEDQVQSGTVNPFMSASTPANSGMYF